MRRSRILRAVRAWHRSDRLREVPPPRRTADRRDTNAGGEQRPAGRRLTAVVVGAAVRLRALSGAGEPTDVVGPSGPARGRPAARRERRADGEPGAVS